MKSTIVKHSSYKINYCEDKPLEVVVALYRIEKTIFSRPTLPYYIEVRNNGFISQEFLHEDSAFHNFMQISAFWHLEEMRNTMISKEGNFMQEIISRREDSIYKILLGVNFTLAGFSYNEISNKFSAYLMDNGDIESRAKQLGIKTISFTDAYKIAWKLTDKSVHLCKVYIDDSVFPYSDILSEEIIYTHQDYNKAFHIIASRITQSLFNMNPTKCKILYANCKLP